MDAGLMSALEDGSSDVSLRVKAQTWDGRFQSIQDAEGNESHSEEVGGTNWTHLDQWEPTILLIDT